MSLRSGRVPDELKSARVVPLYKKTVRPMRVNIMSKVFERAVFNQLNSYLLVKRLLYELQSGFRQKISTATSLIHLHDYIRLECEIKGTTQVTQVWFSWTFKRPSTLLTTVSSYKSLKP